MASFKDASGREWKIILDAPTIERIKADRDGFDLSDSAKAVELLQDPVVLCGVLYLACKKQVQRRRMTQKTFYLYVLRNSIAAATDALIESWKELERNNGITS